MEQSTLRSRSFRRFFLASCSLFLFAFTLHSLSSRERFHQTISESYQYISRKDSYTRTTRPRHIAPQQIALQSDDEQSEDDGSSINEHIKDLPEVVRIPFEEAVRDVSLHGWEDEWLSSANFDFSKYGSLDEPKLDFVYNWVNGSEIEFNAIKHKYELSSPLNRPDGKWISQHSVNRYRDWDELKYSFRSLEQYAQPFINKIQLLVNSVYNGSDMDSEALRPQRPNWLKDDLKTRQNVQILAQEDFFGEAEKQCLPSFDSVSIESQIHRTPSNVDQLVALSDDMFLGAPHSAADFYSPLFGSVMGFKPDHYNVKNLKRADVPTFGEKPYLYYTSWLLNRRFGDRDRKAQAHFTHSISRRVMKEALASFPSSALRGACERFRGESRFQIYPWYAAFHYSIERFREALLWSFIMTRADANGDGYLDWSERQAMMNVTRHGRHLFGVGDASTPVPPSGRDRMFYQLPAIHKKAGLQPPLANTDVLWTSLDGPETIRNVRCHNFRVDTCFADSFDSPTSDAQFDNSDFTTANIFTQLSKRDPKCGDCLIKFMLSTTKRGLEPLLPPKSKPHEREVVVKALTKYQHTLVEPEAKFVMVKDAEQAEHDIFERTIKRKQHVSQWCLNDDVMTANVEAVSKVNDVIQNVFRTLFPRKSRYEVD